MRCAIIKGITQMTKINPTRLYSQLVKLKTFEERFEYLKLSNVVAENTFGFDRYLNQKFYKSTEWKDLRNYIISRDLGCDLGVDGYYLDKKDIVIHHMNPICPDDFYEKTKFLMDPEYLICCSHNTHRAIHYGSELSKREFDVRAPNDQCPWK